MNKYKIEVVLIKGLKKILGFFPLMLRFKFAEFLGMLTYYIIKKRRSLTFENLKIAFPEKSVKELRKIAKESYKTVAKNTFIPLFLTELIEKKAIEIDNINLAKELYGRGKGLILTTLHMGGFEAGFSLAKWFDVYTVFKKQKNPYLNDLMTSYREKTGAKTILKNVENGSNDKIAECFRNKGLLILASDQYSNGVDIEFFGKTAHAAGSPEKGINALHALIHLYNVLHSHQSSKFKNLNIHGVITDGGKAPNVIPDYAKARFYIRGTASSESREAVNAIEDILKGIDKAFGTTSKLTYFQNRVDHFILTPEFDKLFCDIYEDYTGTPLETGQTKPGGSTDAANVSHVTPVIHPYLAIGDSSLTGHTIEFADAACSEKGFGTLLLAVKLLSLTALELYKDSELLGKIKDDWNKSINSPK